MPPNAASLPPAPAQIATLGADLIHRLPETVPLEGADRTTALCCGGPVIAAFLRALPGDWRDRHLVIDATLVWLATGSSDGPRFFHHEPFPGVQQGPLAEANRETTCEHIVACLGTDADLEYLDAGPAIEPLAETLVDDAVITALHARHRRVMAGLDAGRWRAHRLPTGTLLRHGPGCWQRRCCASRSGFHIWIRATSFPAAHAASGDRRRRWRIAASAPAAAGGPPGGPAGRLRGERAGPGRDAGLRRWRAGRGARRHPAGASGRITVLVGPNGSGKSTLLRGLARQLLPRSGGIRLIGEDLLTLSPQTVARRLALLAQEHDQRSDLTVEQLVLHGRHPHRRFLAAPTAADGKAVERALALTGIGELRTRSLAELSGGRRQLAWLALALAQEAPVLALDEPTTFLDIAHQLHLMDLLRRLVDSAGLTVLAVLHDLDQAARYADHLVVLDHGAVVAAGPPPSVLSADLLATVFGIRAELIERNGRPQLYVGGALPADGDWPAIAGSAGLTAEPTLTRPAPDVG